MDFRTSKPLRPSPDGSRPLHTAAGTSEELRSFIEGDELRSRCLTTCRVKRPFSWNVGSSGCLGQILSALELYPLRSECSLSISHSCQSLTTLPHRDVRIEEGQMPTCSPLKRSETFGNSFCIIYKVFGVAAFCWSSYMVPMFATFHGCFPRKQFPEMPNYRVLDSGPVQMVVHPCTWQCSKVRLFTADNMGAFMCFFVKKQNSIPFNGRFYNPLNESLLQKPTTDQLSSSKAKARHHWWSCSCIAVRGPCSQPRAGEAAKAIPKKTS